MRLVFLGTPEIAVPHLRALVHAGHEVELVVTGADKRRSRRQSNYGHDQRAEGSRPFPATPVLCVVSCPFHVVDLR